MNAIHFHHITQATGSGPNHNFETGGLGGFVLGMIAYLFGWIEGQTFLVELFKTAAFAGVGAAASFTVSYYLNRKFRGK